MMSKNSEIRPLTFKEASTFSEVCKRHDSKLSIRLNFMLRRAGYPEKKC